MSAATPIDVPTVPKRVDPQPRQTPLALDRDTPRTSVYRLSGAAPSATLTALQWRWRRMETPRLTLAGRHLSRALTSANSRRSPSSVGPLLGWFFLSLLIHDSGLSGASSGEAAGAHGIDATHGIAAMRAGAASHNIAWDRRSAGVAATHEVPTTWNNLTEVDLGSKWGRSGVAQGPIWGQPDPRPMRGRSGGGVQGRSGVFPG